MSVTGATAVGSKIRGNKTRRNPQTGAMRLQRRMGLGKGMS